MGEPVLNKPTELTLGQKLKLREFELIVERMSLEQAQEFLIGMYGQMLVRESAYKSMLKTELLDWSHWNA